MPLNQTRRLFLLLNLLALAAILINSISRDIQLEKQYPGDLRNRVVGARLQKDGKSPYFYKWKTGDDYRYLDIQNNDSLKVSNISASPFFHDLLMPVCELSQRTISKIWMWLQYIFLVIIVIIFSTLTKNIISRWFVINVPVVFTLSDAWKSMIANGQIYFLNALLITGIIAGLLKPKKITNIWIAALSAVTFVLVRPIAILIFIPFLLTYKRTREFLIASGSIFLFYTLLLFANPKQLNFWKDYYYALQEQVKLHQDASPTLQQNEKLPVLDKLEGFDFNEVNENYKLHPINIHSENGNFFVLVEKITHFKISSNALMIILASAIVSLSILFLFLRTRIHFETWQIILFSSLLYMLAEMMSPIHRHQYNTVQWLPILLLVFVFIEKIPPGLILLVLLGYILNVTYFEFIPLRHTIGECIWLISLFLIACMKPMNRTAWNLR